MRCEHDGLNVLSFFYLFRTECVFMEIIQPYSKFHLRPHPTPFYRDVDPDPDLTYCIRQY